MTDVTHSHIHQNIIRLLNYYSFDAERRPMSFVVAEWMGCYPLRWILEAIIEALYQGRYKTISVEQILIIWQRRGHPLHHFNGEFERIVCGRLGDAVANGTVPLNAAKMDIGSFKDRETGNNGPAISIFTLDRELSNNSDRLGAEPTTQELDCIEHDCMEYDGRLSELLGEDINLTKTESSISCSSPSTTASSPFQNQSLLKPLDSETHKLPVRIFKPVESSCTMASEWQQLTETTIRHHPIHQFTPIKASPTMYNKLKAIAHNYSVS